jgi:hypothetical protein
MRGTLHLLRAFDQYVVAAPREAAETARLPGARTVAWG